MSWRVVSKSRTKDRKYCDYLSVYYDCSHPDSDSCSCSRSMCPIIIANTEELKDF